MDNSDFEASRAELLDITEGLANEPSAGFNGTVYDRQRTFLRVSSNEHAIWC